MEEPKSYLFLFLLYRTPFEVALGFVFRIIFKKKIIIFFIIYTNVKNIFLKKYYNIFLNKNKQLLSHYVIVTGEGLCFRRGTK
jgi:hypothetical protein